MPNVVTDTGIRTPIASSVLLGMVAENQATNLCLQSQTFDNAAWTKSDAVITADNAAAPDGSLTADTFTDNVNNVVHRINTGTIAVTNGVSYTASLYIKPGTLPWVHLQFYDGVVDHWANFNLTTGAVGFTAGSVTTAVRTLPNGWLRVSITWTSTTTGNGNLYIASINADINNGAPPYVGTGQTMYLWGAMVEAASDASSYIPTVAASVTRNGEDLRYQKAGNFGEATGTTYAECYLPVAGGAAYQAIFNETAANYGVQRYVNTKVLQNWSPGGQPGTVNTRTVGAVNKSAAAWSGATVSICLNGGAVATAAFAAYSAAAGIQIGSTGGVDCLQGTIRNVRFYATRLTDVQLQAMTA